jgi:DNA-directed RNA polymerase specialized sigma24 family protein
MRLSQDCDKLRAKLELQVHDMSQEGSVSRHIRDLKGGSAEAEERLFRQYVSEMTHLAVANMKYMLGERAAALDPEIAAESALRSILDRIKTGKEERLFDRNQLFAFLVARLRNKIVDQWRTETAKKRGEGMITADSDVFAAAKSLKPTPEEVLRFQELLVHALAALPNDDIRRIALLELEGYTDMEIGGIIGRSLRAVQLKLKLIRAIWQERLDRDAYVSPA